MADKDGITRCDMADTVAFMALSKAIDPRSKNVPWDRSLGMQP